VRVVAAQRPVDRRRGEEDHVRAAVVVACSAGRAGGLGAGDAVFESYAVAWKEEKRS
jgi:hypothetical protein